MRTEKLFVRSAVQFLWTSLRIHFLMFGLYMQKEKE